MKQRDMSCLLYTSHGGGYSTGSTVYARTLTTKLAESTGMDVFCFNYRLAPECKFPAAAEDAMKAWNYLMYLGYGAREDVYKRQIRISGKRTRRKKKCWKRISGQDSYMSSDREIEDVYKRQS